MVDFYIVFKCDLLPCISSQKSVSLDKKNTMMSIFVVNQEGAWKFSKIIRIYVDLVSEIEDVCEFCNVESRIYMSNM